MGAGARVCARWETAGRGATYRHLGIQALVIASPNRGSMHGSAPPS
jgi:hypothetical protein